MCLAKYVSIQMQRSCMIEGDPLTEYLRLMSNTIVGKDIGDIFFWKKTRVVFLPIGGCGVAPFQGTILLDNIYRDRPMETKYITIVAHELAHLLQRELDIPEWFPSGNFKPSLTKRWIGDSTNYMEVLAYLVGWAIWYDLSSNPLVRLDLSGHIRILTGNKYAACEHIRDKFYWVDVYKKNQILEDRTPLNRIPPGEWWEWLGYMGFTNASINRIFDIASGVN